MGRIDNAQLFILGINHTNISFYGPNDRSLIIVL